MKKYLVTGAAGFIGANFVKYILKKWGNDVEIIILIRIVGTSFLLFLFTLYDRIKV